MTKSDDLDDLIVLGRRGELGDADERKLREQLATSDDAQALYDAGRAFDREAPVEPGDERRLARIVSGVERRVRRTDSARPRWIGRILLAAMLLGGAAVAAVEYRAVISRSTTRAPVEDPAPANSKPAYGMRLPSPAARSEPAPAPTELAPVPPEPAIEPSPVPTPPPRRPIAPRTAAIAPADEVHVEVPPPPAEPLPTIEPLPPVTEPPPTAVPDTALSLFAAGNRARVQGDAREAISRWSELEKRFPVSKEALAAHLSLGMLYLQDHTPALALDEFRNYRAANVTSMMAEAIWGESQALRALGRDSEERASLEELLRAYPQSAYAAAATKRLGELHR